MPPATLLDLLLATRSLALLALDFSSLYALVIVLYKKVLVFKLSARLSSLKDL
ncbi:hypothetical protein PTT_10130 [Pyrenophora teres f. teres 0-1]|uniref:Uncharacterized protein n=1 Tax=Pyrenophora teres f. teres (strain 0-1) TaxID=861557 RepID=E3RNI2_PYRTT|nr:hypothetical protein PTT_10130 [Pyrenophora teres f. teres 0-1]